MNEINPDDLIRDVVHTHWLFQICIASTLGPPRLILRKCTTSCSPLEASCLSRAVVAAVQCQTLPWHVKHVAAIMVRSNLSFEEMIMRASCFLKFDHFLLFNYIVIFFRYLYVNINFFSVKSSLSPTLNHYSPLIIHAREHYSSFDNSFSCHAKYCNIYNRLFSKKFLQKTKNKVHKYLINLAATLYHRYNICKHDIHFLI